MTKAWLLALVIAVCPPGIADTPKAREESPGKRFEHDMMVRFHMHQNFDLVRAIERLLIRGKLEDAQRFAEAIASAPDEPAHGPWAAQALVVRDRAQAVARAISVDHALRKHTQLAAACASCHRELDVTPMFQSLPPPPPDKPTIFARMARHRWAADRLWEAVVGNSDEAWQDGLDVLAAAPIELGEDRAVFARNLQQLANRARQTKRPIEDRATAYGEILVTCAVCHAKTR